MNLFKSELRKVLYTKTFRLSILGATFISLLSSIPSPYITQQAGGLIQNASFMNPEIINGLYSKALAGYLFSAIFGVILMAGEFKEMTAVRTFLASPKRIHVVYSKLVIAVLGGAIIMLISTTLGAVGAYFALKHYPHTAPTSSMLPTLLGDALLTGASIGVLGLAVGKLIRNQNIAVTGTIIYLYIVERMIVLFWSTGGKWLPSGLLTAMMNVNVKISSKIGGFNYDPSNYLKPTYAAMLLVGYSVIAGAIAIKVSLSRDID